MSTKDRLKSYIKNSGATVSDFEKSIDASNGYVNSISKGIGGKYLEKIRENYTDLNIDWLLYGEGEMLLSTNKNHNMANEPSERYLTNESQKIGIPLIPIDAMAGFGKGETTVLEVDCERFVIPTFQGADFLITVKGSSMYPKYNSGDIVACKKLPLNDLFFQWNKVYVLDTVQGALVKRIKKGIDGDSILIFSDNLSYDAFELHKSQINAVALVIGVIRLE